MSRSGIELCSNHKCPSSQQLEREKSETAWIQISEDQSDSLDRGYTQAGATNSFSHIRALNHLSAGIISSYLHVTKRDNRISSALPTSSQVLATMMGKFKSMHDKCKLPQLSNETRHVTLFQHYSVIFTSRFIWCKASAEFIILSHTLSLSYLTMLCQFKNHAKSHAGVLSMLRLSEVTCSRNKAPKQINRKKS